MLLFFFSAFFWGSVVRSSVWRIRREYSLNGIVRSYYDMFFKVVIIILVFYGNYY